MISFPEKKATKILKSCSAISFLAVATKALKKVSEVISGSAVALCSLCVGLLAGSD